MANESNPYGDPDRLPSGISDDVREKLVAIMESGRPQHKTWDRDSHIVTLETCEFIKDMHEEGVSPSVIVDLFPIKSHSTVYYHVNDNCSHTHRVRLTYSECGWMRVKAGNGKSSKELAEEYDITQRVASRHILGDCNHEDGIAPIDPAKLRSNGYDGITMTTSVCASCGKEFEHPKTRDRTTCSVLCNGRYATAERAKLESPTD